MAISPSARTGYYSPAVLFKRAVESRSDLVVVDEIGPLEMGGKGLMPAVELALASAVEVLIVVGSSLKEALQRRFPEYKFMVVADLTGSRSNGSELADSRTGEAAARQSPGRGRQPKETE